MMPTLLPVNLPKSVRDLKRQAGYGYCCPKCSGPTAVVDSRPTNEGAGVRRRRLCVECCHRFSTFELESDLTNGLVETCAGLMARCETLGNLAAALGAELAALQKTARQVRGDAQ